MEIDAKKLKLINELTEMAKGRNSDEILPLLLAATQKSKQLGLTFTKDETKDIINSLKSDLTDSDKARIDMLLSMLS